jgi:hypothetical protein
MTRVVVCFVAVCLGLGAGCTPLNELPTRLDASASEDVIAPEDVAVVDVPVLTTDVPVATDVPVSMGLRLVQAGIVTVGPATSASGALQITAQGLEGADRQCAGTLCWTGAVEP